jgi:signal transduction histidine kinase
MSGIGLVRWLWRPVPGVREVGWGDLALAAFLTFDVVIICCGALPGAVTDNPAGRPAAGLLAVTMTLPVLWERRAPAVAAVAVALGAVANEFLIGPMVRCGPALPAVLAIGFFAGTRLRPAGLAVAVAALAGSMVTQSFYDPHLGGPSFLQACLPVLAGAVLAGRLARAHRRAAADLRTRNAELRAQRERTAALAVAADRARVGADLDAFLRDRIDGMARVARAGRAAIGTDPEAARRAFAAVETSGRATLTQMRDVVGTLRAERLTQPQPVLAELGGLLDRATSADARLRVEGSPRSLPAGIELSAYRIVEHLLTVLEDEPAARVDVRLRFGPDALELDVTGPPSPHGDPAAALAAARERVALTGGTLRLETAAGRYAALVRLPLAARY